MQELQEALLPVSTRMVASVDDAPRPSEPPLLRL